MNKIYLLIGSLLLIVPNLVLGAVPTYKTKTLIGTITKISVNQITFQTSSAATYKVETWPAKLSRKNGAAMRFEEMFLGDKVEVKGDVWTDNSINASLVRNLSLYAHNSSFSGKIISLNQANSSFTIQSGQTTQTITTDQFTSFKKNGSGAAFANLQPGMTAKVKGVWERKSDQVAAKSVEATLKLVSIEFNGRLVMKSALGFGVVGENNALYGVDITSAKLQNKKGQTISWDQFNLTEQVKVTGKHISGRLEVTASIVKQR